ncbi:MAG: hypothetical protein ACRC46_02680 [Thermoguttaceae bacterium]
MGASIDCFFNSRAFNAAWEPCTRKFSPDYHIYLRELLQEYTHHLEKDWRDVRFFSTDGGGANGFTLSDIINPILLDVPKLSVAINNATESFLQGHWSTAIQHFDEAMAGIKEHLNNIRVVHLDHSKDSTIAKLQALADIATNYSHSELFRVRTLSEKEKKSPTPNMLLHAPFEIREKVGAGRFNFPGVLCLYLSSSPIIAAIEEMQNKPDKDYEDTYYSRFNWNADKYSPNFIELQVTPTSLGKLCSKMIGEIGDHLDDIRKQYVQSYLACWPLQLACSMPVKHRNDNDVFKEEYIIPQLLMHWLQQNTNKDDFHGVCYRTTLLMQSIEASGGTKPKYIVNYALPTKSIKDNGYCDELLSLFSEIKTPSPINNLWGDISVKEFFEKLQAYSS